MKSLLFAKGEYEAEQLAGFWNHLVTYIPET